MLKLEGWANERLWDDAKDSMEPVFIVVERDYRFLFVGTIIVFVDNSRLVDNSWELIDNVRDKYLLIDKR